MRVHHWVLLGAIALAAFVPTQKANAVTPAGTVSFSDLGPGGNQLNFVGAFNPLHASSSGEFAVPYLDYNSPVTFTTFLTITANDNNFNWFSTTNDTMRTTFNFTQPGSVSGSVTGTGRDTSLLFVLDNGSIKWSGPATINFPSGLRKRQRGAVAATG